MKSSGNTPVIKVDHISKTFTVKSAAIPVVRDVSFAVDRGEFVIIYGPSGSGKSTLLHMLLGLETPSKGKVVFLGRDYESMSDDERADFRKDHIGMVYQQPNWIKALSVRENVAFALQIDGETEANAVVKADALLKSVNMEPWSDYNPAELSSGQQQKVALARAIIGKPDLIVADEPTGNLDYESGRELMEIIKNLNSQGSTIIMVTHDLEYLKYSNRAIKFFDGRITEDTQTPHPDINKRIPGKP